jgi:NADPH:quinone reductase-like Zn-dependent oxidoreductase
MKAIVYENYGSSDVLKIKEIEKPIPKANEVLIRVFATSVTNADCLMRKAESWVDRLFLGFKSPRKKVLGTEFSGEIDSVGKDVKKFTIGDKVYGFTGFGLGAYSENICMNENGSLVSKPNNLTHEESAVLVDGATTALFFLKEKGKIKPGQKVLIIGASGNIGTYATQIAKHYGAEVTGVCSSRNVEFVKSNGAVKVVDYTKQDFTQSKETYDIIFDTATKSSFSKCKHLLNPNGCYLVTMIKFAPLIQTLWTKLLGGKKVIFAMSINKTNYLKIIKELAEKGIVKPTIDRTFSFAQIGDAHRYVEEKHKAGNIAISLVV